MAEFFVCLLPAVFVAVVIAGVLLAVKAARRRREELAALAGRLGLAFEPGPDHGFEHRFPQFECFHRGHSRAAMNLLVGPLPRSSGGSRGEERPPSTCVAGDYRFSETQGSGKHQRTVTYHFSFVLIETPWRGLPETIIRREGVLDRIAGLMGFGDIDFESAEFSRRFHVKTPDRRFAYDLIDPLMMEFLLAGNAPSVDIGNQAFCLWYGQSTRLSPQELEALLDWAARFLERWPRVLVSRLEEERGSRHRA